MTPITDTEALLLFLQLCPWPKLALGCVIAGIAVGVTILIGDALVCAVARRVAK